MYKILIDSTKRFEKKVSLFLDSKELAYKQGDIDIVASIDSLLKESNLSTKDIQIFDVNKGPGSFTGLKIGVTIANVLNWALKGIPVSDLVLPDYGKDPNIQPRKS